MKGIIENQYGRKVGNINDFIEIQESDWNNKDKNKIAIWDNKIGEYRYYKRK